MPYAIVRTFGTKMDLELARVQADIIQHYRSGLCANIEDGMSSELVDQLGLGESSVGIRRMSASAIDYIGAAVRLMASTLIILKTNHIVTSQNLHRYDSKKRPMFNTWCVNVHYCYYR